MNKIFELSAEISEMPVLKQKKSFGGAGISLSTITVIGTIGVPSFDFPSSDWGGSSGGGGGGGNPDNGDDGPGDNINDPNGALDAAKSEINKQIEALKQALQSDLITNEKDIKDAQEVIDALEQTKNTIDLLKDSDNKYRIDVKPGYDGDPTKASGELTFDKETGEFVITIEGTDGQYLPTFAHELEHANQLENGELYVGEDGSIYGYDINDEVDAYDIQHKISTGVYFDTTDLNGKNVNGPYEVTPEEIYKQFPGIYDHLKDNGAGDPEPSEPSHSGSHV